MSSSEPIRFPQGISLCSSSSESQLASPLASSETSIKERVKEPIHTRTFTESESRISRHSLESGTTSSRRQLDLKEYQDPPPLFLDHKEFYPKQSADDSSMIETIASESPRVEPCPSSCTPGIESPQSMSPISQRRLSEEEIRRRRHEKVMRTLGEHIPIELVHRGAKIPNVTVFPDPPCLIDSGPSSETVTKSKVSKQKNFTLATFSHLSLLTASLTSHTRSKSQGKLGTFPMIPTPHLISRQGRTSDIIMPKRDMDRLTTIPRPERPATVYSAVVFATTIDCSRSSCLDDENENLAKPVPITDEEAERAAKLIRRTSILSTAPLRSYEWEPLNHPDDGHLIIVPRESTVLFAPGSIAVNNADMDHTGNTKDKSLDVDDDDESTSGTQTRTQRKVLTQSESGHELSTPSPSHLDSWPHLPMHVRSEMPFHENGVPIGDKSGWPVPVFECQSQGKDLIHREEVRQGWSGEWNQGDMQDVITKLRNLK